jgi:hypothetical protein
MPNYKMNRNRKELSDEDLRKKMDFDRFIQDYKPAPFYRNWKFYTTLVAVTLLVSGAYFLSKEEAEIAASGKHTVTPSFINPPLPGIDIPDTIYELNPLSDTILYYASGSSLHIPARAFLTDKGVVAKGRVMLHYRELHDVADFFVSGIPMTYDSAGRNFHFESAGMLDIGAFQNGELVYANPDAPITVELASDVKESLFNIYYLDTAEKKWNYVKADRMRKGDTEAPAHDRSSRFKAPVKAAPAQPRFDIAFDKKLFPELTVYEGVSFQVCADEKNYDRKLAMKEWDQVKIERHTDGIHYLVTFSNPGEEHVFKVEPVFTGTDYERAKGLYDEKIKSYETALAKGKSIADAKKLKMDSIYKVQYDNMQTANDQARMVKRFGSEKDATVNLIFRQFTISRFGIWNSDCPQSLPQGKMIIARFMDDKKNKFDFDHVYLVEKGRKVMYSYYPDRFNKFSYNPESQNLLWAVTKDNKLAVFGSEEFEKIKKDRDSSDFKMNVFARKISSVLEVKKALGI